MAKSVLTLIAPPDKRKLTYPLVARVEATLIAEGGRVIATEWLAMEEACDLIFTHIEPVAAYQCARTTLEDAPVDIIVQDTAHRQKRLLISDMDSTIITIECIDEIADFAGIKQEVASITERAMRGEIEFTEALTARVKLLKDLPQSALQRVYDERVAFMPGARELIATMRAHGAYTMLISGGFDFFTSRVRAALGFDEDASNRLEIRGGKLTGVVLPPILDKSAKLMALLQSASRLGISTAEVLAAGDGANDVPMLLAAGLGVAYHAKPVVQQSARACINHCDLTALLYAQGYRKEDFVTF